jgi:putative transposase
MLNYKAERYGTQLGPADRGFPTRKLSSTPYCGYVKKDLTRADREWICPACDTWHDRDGNAAQNLARLATETAYLW